MAPANPTTPNSNKKNASGKAKRKKQRISKHVIMARENKSKDEQHEEFADLLPDEALAAAAAAPIVPNSAKTSEKKQKKKKTKKHVKDPSEALAYLSGWKYRAVEGSVWKFNKNTQSWLIRHMYEPEKVSKDMFTLLMEYLTGLEGITRQRVVADASSRAVRYKEYESKTQNKKGNDDETSKPKNTDDTNEITASNEAAAAIARNAESPTTDAEEKDRWNRLSDHDKRKEYKRARKVLDTLKAKK